MVINPEFEELKDLKRKDDQDSKKPLKIIKKDTWDNDIEFLLSCITVSIGLGNVWRFPFTALENGGGTFVIIYTLIVFLVGKPIYYMELLMGQFSSRGCVKVYDMAPVARGVGFGQCICTIIVLTIYVSVMALTIRYFLASFSDPLPWSLCDLKWNTSCIDSGLKTRNITSGNNAKSSAELFFVKDILKEKLSIENGLGSPDLALILCLILSWTFIGLVLMKGIRSSGKVAYILAVCPYVVLLILLVRAATLEGAIDGMLYFILPEWKHFLDAKLWYAAVTQVFYALGICFGSIIMYSSYNRFDQNVYRDMHIITSMDYSASLLAGFIIFGILGHLAHVMGIEDIQEVTKSYMGLAFIAYPETIAKFEFIPQFFSVSFFMMLFFFCVGSNMGMASCIMTVIRDQFPHIKCWKIVIVIVAFGISIGCIYTTPGGQFLINFLDFYGASFVALILAITELLTVGWIYGVDRFCNDIEFMLGRKTGLYWRLCWKYVTPFIMIFIFVYFVWTWKSITYQDIQYSSQMHAFGWFISLLGLLQLPIWACYAIFNQQDSTWKMRIINAFKPTKNWGPNDLEKMKRYKEFIKQQNYQWE